MEELHPLLAEDVKARIECYLRQRYEIEVVDGEIEDCFNRSETDTTWCRYAGTLKTIMGDDEQATVKAASEADLGNKVINRCKLLEVVIGENRDDLSRSFSVSFTSGMTNYDSAHAVAACPIIVRCAIDIGKTAVVPRGYREKLLVFLKKGVDSRALYADILDLVMIDGLLLEDQVKRIKEWIDLISTPLFG